MRGTIQKGKERWSILTKAESEVGERILNTDGEYGSDEIIIIFRSVVQNPRGPKDSISNNVQYPDLDISNLIPDHSPNRTSPKPHKSHNQTQQDTPLLSTHFELGEPQMLNPSNSPLAVNATQTLSLSFACKALPFNITCMTPFSHKLFRALTTLINVPLRITYNSKTVVLLHVPHLAPD